MYRALGLREENKSVKFSDPSGPMWRVSVFWAATLGLARFCFPDGHTDTMNETTDYLFGRGLVGQ